MTIFYSLQTLSYVVSSSTSFQSCWFLSLLKFLFKLKWRQKRMLKPRHDLQTSYFESSRLLTYFPLTEFCWTQQQPSHCFWHKLPFLTMCEKSWHELSWHLTHLLRSSKNSVEIESARKETIEYKFHLILGDYFQHALSLHQM